VQDLALLREDEGVGCVEKPVEAVFPGDGPFLDRA
jgi:hypothetical protein